MRFIGFFLRLVLVVALVVWLADRPGTAQIAWRDYVIDTSAAVLAVIVAALAYAAVLLHRLWRFIWDGPRFWKLKRKIAGLQDGQVQIAKGFAALAAGQAADAGKAAIRARKLLGETPMTRLIQAQAAQLAGDRAMARSLFEAMTGDPETAILGYRGLIVDALRRGAFDEAGRVINRVEQTKAEVPWLHLARFEMESRQQHWSLAAGAVDKARKAKALPRPQADFSAAALLLAEAKDFLRQSEPRKALELAEKARKLAPSWLPSALILAEAQIAAGHERAALRTVERAWNQVPNPQLIPLAQWAARSSKTIDAYRLVEKMTRSSREDTASLMALAEAALKADLWGEARRFLMLLVSKGQASQMTYQLLARLERREKGNETLASSWLAKAIVAPPDPQWLCASCGAAHEYWQPACESCGAFNQLLWGVPGKGRAKTGGEEPLSLSGYFG